MQPRTINVVDRVTPGRAGQGQGEAGMANIDDIIHLLRRTEFIARTARVTELTPLTLEDAVDNILDFAQNASLVAPPEYFTYDSMQNGNYRVGMHNWWIDRMATAPRPFHEKMTLFWHGHFVTDWSTTERTDLMMKQIDLDRTHAIGNFRTFTHAMALDPQMLRYLSNATNVKANPNENFARELLELFTLGVGNYTQDDIAAAARAWTGHNLNNATQTYLFRSQHHDTDPKTFFGTTKNWDGPDIIDEILRDNAPKQLVAAKYMAKKLWEFLAYDAPAQNIVDELADVFVQNDMEIRPLVRAVLLRPEFYSAQARQGLVRSPVEWCVAILAHGNLTANQSQVYNWSLMMGQRVMDPPNVAGWKNNEYYLTTSSLAGRANFARRCAGQLRLNGGFNFAQSLSTPDAVDAVAAFFGLSLAPSTREALMAGVNAERAASGATSSTAITNLLICTMLTGEMNAPS